MDECSSLATMVLCQSSCPISNVHLFFILLFFFSSAVFYSSPGHKAPLTCCFLQTFFFSNIRHSCEKRLARHICLQGFQSGLCPCADPIEARCCSCVSFCLSAPVPTAACRQHREKDLVIIFLIDVHGKTHSARLPFDCVDCLCSICVFRH